MAWELFVVESRPFLYRLTLRKREANTMNYRSREGWKNVTIWWGNAGDKSPYTPPFQAFDLRVKRVMQCSPVRGSNVTAREVALPYVTGVGGTKGAWAFM